LLALTVLVFFFIGVYASYLFYSTVRAYVGRTDLPALPVIQLPSLNQPEAAAEKAAEEPLPQLPEMTPMPGLGDLAFVAPEAPAAAAERINVLLLGIDRRGGTGWVYRTDTIMIGTVDPINKTAGVLSIPRDLQIPIPGNGEDRINTANAFGESHDYPGGGPSLLKRTIEVNFGIPIDYYVMIDFQGFEKIVDTLGGIEIYVPKELHDTQYPDPQPNDPYAYRTVHFDAGWQTMNGARALRYARSRMSTSDFDRAKRQQQILVAIGKKALNLNLLPKLPVLASTMASMVKTDMTYGEMVDLARLAPQIDLDQLKQVVLEKPLVYGYRREDTAAVQLPKWDLINPVIADLFAAPAVAQVAPPTATPVRPAPTPTLAAIQIEHIQALAAEGARIAIQNGTTQPNFAAQVAAILMQQGYQVVEFGDADRMDYASTVLVDYTGKTYTIERLVELFQVTPDNVRHSPNLRSQIDIRVIVGESFLLSQP